MGHITTISASSYLWKHWSDFHENFTIRDASLDKETSVNFISRPNQPWRRSGRSECSCSFQLTFDCWRAVGYCDPSPDVLAATKNTTLAAPGTVVWYQCDIGYRFTEGTSAIISCDGIGWSAIEPECQGGPLRTVRSRH